MKQRIMLILLLFVIIVPFKGCLNSTPNHERYLNIEVRFDIHQLSNISINYSDDFISLILAEKSITLTLDEYIIDGDIEIGSGPIKKNEDYSFEINSISTHPIITINSNQTKIIGLVHIDSAYNPELKLDNVPSQISNITQLNNDIILNVKGNDLSLNIQFSVYQTK